MALTVSDILDRARQRYNAVGDDFFPDVMLREALFDAQSQLAKDGWVIEKTLETTSAIGTRELTWPENTLGIKSITYNYDKLSKVSLRQDPKTSTDTPTGTPRGYGLWDDVIFLYPAPDTEDDKIQIRTYSYPQDITANDDSIEVPQEYREDLIKFVVGIMAQKDQNFTLYDRLMNDWDVTVQKAAKQRKKRLRGDMNARTQDLYFGGDAPTTVDQVFYNGW